MLVTEVETRAFELGGECRQFFVEWCRYRNGVSRILDLEVFALAEISERTGVEMEALTGVSIALLTIWDLVKPVNPALEISAVRLLYKSGGKKGEWRNPDGLPPEAEALLT